MNTFLHIRTKATKIFNAWHYSYLLMLTRNRIKALQMMMDSPFKGDFR